MNNSMDSNVDEKVAQGFGDEWSTFRQGEEELSPAQRQAIFENYFSIFPWDALPEEFQNTKRSWMGGQKQDYFSGIAVTIGGSTGRDEDACLASGGVGVIAAVVTERPDDHGDDEGGHAGDQTPGEERPDDLLEDTEPGQSVAVRIDSRIPG